MNHDSRVTHAPNGMTWTDALFSVNVSAVDLFAGDGLTTGSHPTCLSSHYAGRARLTELRWALPALAPTT